MLFYNSLSTSHLLDPGQAGVVQLFEQNAILLGFPDDERNTQVGGAAVARNEYNRAAARSRASLIGGRETVASDLCYQNHIGSAHLRSSAVKGAVPDHVGVPGRD